jgi:hypothetical protein
MLGTFRYRCTRGTRGRGQDRGDSKILAGTLRGHSQERSVRVGNGGVVALRVAKAGGQKAFPITLIVRTLKSPFFNNLLVPLSSHNPSVRVGNGGVVARRGRIQRRFEFAHGSKDAAGKISHAETLNSTGVFNK